jgi:DNA-binding NtrC family response regulator
VLRAIEDGEILPLGSTKTRRIDVRILAATNKDLSTMMEKGMFREDLFHRINVLNVHVAPLRERVEDIPVLAGFFLRNACIENNRPLKELRTDAMTELVRYSWPGNVRELKHLMEKTAILIDAVDVSGAHMSELLGMQVTGQGMPGVMDHVEQVRDRSEKGYIIEVLKTTGWVVSRAARILGIDRSTLFRKMRKYNIEKKQ